MSKEMRNMIDNFKKLLTEGKFEDIEVVPAKGVQRGTSSEGGRSFNINIGNPDVVKRMKETPMGEAGEMSSFSHEGPGSGEKKIKWNADTSQWDVWQNMNYIILTPENQVHWYHGKMPGGKFRAMYNKKGPEVMGDKGRLYGTAARVKSDKEFKEKNTSWDKEGHLYPGSTAKPLPDLNIKGFGYKVYKALLNEPTVGYIVSDQSASEEVKNYVYKKLMTDPELIWVASGSGDISSQEFQDMIMINPKFVNSKQLIEKFKSGEIKTHHRTEGVKFYQSK